MLYSRYRTNVCYIRKKKDVFTLALKCYSCRYITQHNWHAILMHMTLFILECHICITNIEIEETIQQNYRRTKNVDMRKISLVTCHCQRVAFKSDRMIGMSRDSAHVIMLSSRFVAILHAQRLSLSVYLDLFVICFGCVMFARYHLMSHTY